MDEVPIFEPFQESLPLQSGFYSFLIDGEGNFRVRRGNTRSHSGMVRGRRAAAAGRFQVNRMGRVIAIVCSSSDFNFYYSNPNHASVQYTIEQFKTHPALNLNPSAIFTFYRSRYGSWHVSANGQIVADIQEHLRQLEDEGIGSEIQPRYSPGQLRKFEGYAPGQPPTLYSMQKDQLVIALEDGPVEEGFEYGPPAARLSPELGVIQSGKNNFVIDQEGWLIIGMTGHQILSGGGEVGGAGHIHIDPSGEVSRIELNFSGHYRPPLTADYARYSYQLIAGHPLLRLSPDCRFAGRVFKDCDAVSTVVEFSKEELESDDPKLDWLIESLSF